MPATAATITPLNRMSTEAAAFSPIRVGLYAASAGVVEAAESWTHRLSLHVGQPVWASCGYIEALESFYGEDASMQENLDPPRRGRKTLIEGERRVMAGFREIRTRKVATFLVEGDKAVINWVFDFVGQDGSTFTQDEIAVQRWHGDKIVEERFYYDPAQRTRGTPKR
jgi:hypothetical protein